MNILVISNNYPSKTFPNYGAFVYNLMQELRKSNEITIISPFKIHHFLKRTSDSYGDEKCEVIRPTYVSTSNKRILGLKFDQISSYFYKKAISKAINKIVNKPDIIYVHFVYNAIPVLAYAEQNNIPIVIASGESTYSFWNKLSPQVQTKLKEQVNQIICVSKENQEQLLRLGFNKDIMSVIPNAVDYSLFRPLAKDYCRKKLGLKNEKFIVGFIGHFIHRKGPNRIIEAIKALNDRDIQLVCVGGKGQLLSNDFTLQIPPVPNAVLPEIYNAFDVFVLPTLHEGHCNVIEEAKACCIPIVSSKGTSVEEQIDESTGILINPLEVSEIGQAISSIKESSNLRTMLIENLVVKRGENSLQERAKKIQKILLDAKNFSDSEDYGR